MDRPETPAPLKGPNAWRHRLARAAILLAALALADLMLGRALLRTRRNEGATPAEYAARLSGEMRTVEERPFLQPGWGDAPPAGGPALVGIFGGSVAYFFARYLEQMGEDVPELPALDRHFGRQVQFVNLAVRGGFEPEQLNLLHLAAHRLSAAIFLDGFNEQFSNSAPACEPMVAFWSRNAATPAELLAPLAHAVSAARNGVDLMQQPALGHSGLLRLYTSWRVARMNKTAADTFVYMAGGFERVGLPIPPRFAPPGAGERWEHCVRYAHDFARGRRLPIYFFVQPNQHSSEPKPFTPEERACCVEVPRDQPPEARAIYARLPQTYADLGARTARLRAGGVAAHALTNLFSDTRETVYADWCCHVNDLGNRLMARAVFGAVTATPAARP